MSFQKTELFKATVDVLSAVIEWVPDSRACRIWAGPRTPFPLTVDSLAQAIGFAQDRSYCLKQGGAPAAFGQWRPKRTTPCTWPE